MTRFLEKSFLSGGSKIPGYWASFDLFFGGRNLAFLFFKVIP
jgi:hypothetical protein